MRGGGPILRISFGLVLLTSTLLMGLDLLGWIPSTDERESEHRLALAEAVAAQVTAGIQAGDLRATRTMLGVTAERNEDVISAAVRSAAGRLLVSVGPHRDAWKPPEGERSTATHMQIPLYRGGEKWATVELRYRGYEDLGLLDRILARPLLRILLFVGVLGFAVYTLYMRRTLRYLDPSAVIPSRVQATLDVMTEGVVVVDPRGDIVMANAAFAERFGLEPVDLMGRSAASFGWCDGAGDPLRAEPPWMDAMADASPFTDYRLTLKRSERERVVLTVNGAPVLDGWGRPSGAIVTFGDVTELERNRSELQSALDELEKSRDEIRLQNEELQQLARIDPLTGAANRRSFMEEAEPIFARARQHSEDLCCLMADIDHFKRVNDDHGHQTGDEAIRRVAGALLTQLSGRGLVCRYGGEEFCALVPEAAAEDCQRIAEMIREQVAAPDFTRVPITVSLGVASVRDGADDLTKLIDQADQALYSSKNSGRNRVTRFDQIPKTD